MCVCVCVDECMLNPTGHLQVQSIQFSRFRRGAVPQSDIVYLTHITFTQTHTNSKLFNQKLALILTFV